MTTLMSGCANSTAQSMAQVSGQRQKELIHFVRQDCGACHGMRLTGGLGPDITPNGLPGRTWEGVAVTILYGHPGTAMPGWAALLSQTDANWIAQHLLAGFPQE